jgi:hypothetical protein
MEGKTLWGYDMGVGKFTMDLMIKGFDNAIYSSWFESKSICEIKYYNPITSPKNEMPEWKIEFKSPNIFLHTEMKNNKPVKTDTWNRVK